jgi:hypothetical protein
MSIGSAATALALRSQPVAGFVAAVGGAAIRVANSGANVFHSRSLNV